MPHSTGVRVKSQKYRLPSRPFGRPYWRGSCRHTVRLSHGPGKTEENLNFQKNASRLQPGEGRVHRDTVNRSNLGITPGVASTRPAHTRHPRHTTPSYRHPTVLPHSDAVSMVGPGRPGAPSTTDRLDVKARPPPSPHHGYRFPPVRRKERSPLRPPSFPRAARSVIPASSAGQAPGVAEGSETSIPQPPHNHARHPRLPPDAPPNRHPAD